MNYSVFSKLMITHFVVAVVITLMVSFALSTVKIDNLAYFGVLFGLYVFAGYGINRLIEDNVVEENYQRYVSAIISIFSICFSLM